MKENQILNEGYIQECINQPFLVRLILKSGTAVLGRIKSYSPETKMIIFASLSTTKLIHLRYIEMLEVTTYMPKEDNDKCPEEM